MPDLPIGQAGPQMPGGGLMNPIWERGPQTCPNHSRAQLLGAGLSPGFQQLLQVDDIGSPLSLDHALDDWLG